MDFFMSGEVMGDSGEELIRIVVKEIEPAIKSLLQSNDYGSDIKEFNVIPILVNLSDEFEEAGFFKERVLFKRKKGEAECRLRIDFHMFTNGNSKLRRLLIFKNIIQSIRIIGERAKKAKMQFDSVRLEQDVLKLFDVNQDVLIMCEL